MSRWETVWAGACLPPERPDLVAQAGLTDNEAAIGVALDSDRDAIAIWIVDVTGERGRIVIDRAAFDALVDAVRAP